MTEPDDPFAPTYGEPTEGEARYLVEPVSGGKRLQATSLLLDSGEEWIVSYRAQPERFHLVDRRVVFRGTPYWPSPNVQHVQGTHVELERLELAPGETARDPVPTELPSPPQVRSEAEVRARLRRYAHCVGTLEALEPLPNERFWSRGTFRLTDGCALTISHIATSKQEYQALVGQQATLLARLGEDSELGLVVQPYAICPGEVARCGMDARPRSPKQKKIR